MSKIVQFPTKESNGYINLKQLFEICDTVESCNFYLDIAETMYRKEDITENELYTLRRIGRSKKLNLV